GTFKPPSTYAATQGDAQVAGDLNHDRYPDLVQVNHGAGTIAVLLNDGSWTEPVPPPGPSALVAAPLATPAPRPDQGTAGVEPGRRQSAEPWPGELLTTAAQPGVRAAAFRLIPVARPHLASDDLALEPFAQGWR